MNQKIKNLDIEKILFWDLESVRANKELVPDSEEYHLYEHKTRNKETDEVLPQAKVIELYKRKAALDRTYNKIVCISMAYIAGGKINVKSITGNQKDIIKEFSNVLSKGFIPCGWNIVGFDFPVLRTKAFEEGIFDYAPERFNDAGKKEWAVTEIKYDTNMIDLMLLAKGTSYSNSSLAECCYTAKIPSPKNDGIEGSQVSEVYYNEGVGRIQKYCERDVISCVHLLQWMRGEQLTQEIVYKTEKEVEELPILQKIYVNGAFTEEIKNEVRELVKNATGEDKINLKKILTAHYQTKGDKVAIKKQKEQEINEFIDTL